MSFASNPAPISMDRQYRSSSFDEVEADSSHREQWSEDRAYPSERPKLGCRKNCMLSCALGGVLCAKRCDVGSLTAQFAFFPPSPATYQISRDLTSLRYYYFELAQSRAHSSLAGNFAARGIEASKLPFAAALNKGFLSKLAGGNGCFGGGCCCQNSENDLPSTPLASLFFRGPKFKRKEDGSAMAQTAGFVVLYFHGNATDLGAVLPNMAELRGELGCSVLAVEYPGYGIYSPRSSSSSSAHSSSSSSGNLDDDVAIAAAAARRSRNVGAHVGAPSSSSLSSPSSPSPSSPISASGGGGGGGGASVSPMPDDSSVNSVNSNNSASGPGRNSNSNSNSRSSRRSNEPSTHGLIASAELALQRASELGFPPSRCVVYGQSIGSGPACALAARHRLAGVVLHSPVASGLRAITLDWNSTCSPVALFACLDPLNNAALATHIHCPVLIAHGAADSEVPIWHGKFIEECRQRKAAAVAAKLNGSFFRACTHGASMASCGGFGSRCIGSGGSSSGSYSNESLLYLAAQARDVSLWVPGAGHGDLVEFCEARSHGAFYDTLRIFMASL